jgi:OmpA-OmpF porin, OOP family
MNKNIITLVVSLLVIAIGAEAQSNTKKFGIEINGGIREYHGDLGSALYFKKAPNYQAVGGAIGMYLNSSFDVNIYGSTGDLGFYKESWDILKAEPYRQGFRSHITEGMIGVTFKLNNGTIMSEDATFKPFIRAGWGVVKSISKFSEGSTLVGDAETYYYASRSRTWLASHWNAAAGFKIGLTDALDLVVSEQFNYSFDDNYDGAPFAIAGARLNSASEGNKPLHDIYLYHNIGFVFNFGSNGNSSGSSYKIKDADDDGISDDFDICPNTPAGYQVDTVGCPLDDDNDGVVNEEDKCPNVAGLKAFNGCPDTDGDGVQDSEDKCPNVSGISEFNGCPDSDKDGVQDSEDKCPLMAGSKEGEGCPDSDGDGVYDHKDVCPATAGPATNKGCPEIKEEVKEKIRIAASGIYFESGKDVIKPQSYANLDLLAGIMQEYMEASVMIEGHTDNQGADDVNLVLSQKRADAVKAYIANKGVNADRMTAIGFGETKPVADNSVNSGRILNRRVDFKLVY